MKRRNAFTLIELLAVIVILAIIALIAVPVVMNIITKVQKSAFKDSAYGVIKAGELYYTNAIMDLDGMKSDKRFSFPNDIDGLEIKGSKPTSGSMVVNKEGKIALAITNGKYCVKKDYYVSDVIITEVTTNCDLPKTLSELVTTSEVLEIAKIDQCIKKGTLCTFGKGVVEPTSFAIKVNDNDIYKFYVINDTGSEVTLIMDRNIGNRIAWGNYNQGPLTAIEELKRVTSDWNNITPKEFIYNDLDGANSYTIDEPFIMTARLPRYKELKDLGCNKNVNTCPKYLYTNLSSENTEEQPYAYWTANTYPYQGLAYNVRSNGAIDGYGTHGGDNKIPRTGIRPIIEIPK